MEVTVRLTLKEVLHKCSDWDKFCDDQGWSRWAVNEGGGDIEVTLTQEEAEEYGII